MLLQRKIKQNKTHVFLGTELGDGMKRHVLLWRKKKGESDAEMVCRQLLETFFLNTVLSAMPPVSGVSGGHGPPTEAPTPEKSSV